MRSPSFVGFVGVGTYLAFVSALIVAMGHLRVLTLALGKWLGLPLAIALAARHVLVVNFETQIQQQHAWNHQKGDISNVEKCV